MRRPSPESTILILWTIFIVYGTTLPLHFDAAAAASGWAEAHRHPLQRPDGTFPSLPDMVSNLLLFLPLGAAVVWRWKRRSVGALLLRATVLSLLLSFGVELLQLFAPGRTTSANDLLCNAVGGLGGALLAIGWLRGPWPRLRGPLLGGLEKDPLRTGLLLALIILGVSALSPFDPSIDVDALKRSVKGARLIPFGPTLQGSTLAMEPLGWISTFLGWSVLGGLLGAWIRREGKRPLWLLLPLGTACFAAVLEFLQIFIRSRTTDATDILLAAGGGLLAALLLTKLGARRELRTGLLLWTLAIIASGLAPLQALSPTLQFPSPEKLVPFWQYFQRTDHHALADLLLSFLSAAPLGLLLFLGWGNSWRKAALYGFVLGLGVELAQLFNAARSPDLTDALSMATGAAIGAWLLAPERTWSRTWIISMPPEGSSAAPRPSTPS